MTNANLGNELFQHFVCRVAGLPVSCMEELRAVRSVEISDELHRLETKIATLGFELAVQLFAVVGGVEDRKTRGSLLQMRRDVHNQRRPKATQVQKVAPLLTSAVAAKLERLCALHAELTEQRLGLEQTFADELLASRQQFRRLVDDSDFQKGLTLSSRDLLSAIRRYKPGRPGTKGRQIERGLMRYLSRMAMKTSPFGTFCAIAAGKFTDDLIDGGEDSLKGLVFEGDPRRKQSLVRLNKGIYEALVPELLRNSAIRERLGVELNPTLQSEDEQWLFLSAEGQREVFRRLPRSPVLDLFKEVIDGHPKLSLRELWRRVGTSRRLDASRAQIEAFTDRLLEIGLLRLRLGVSEQEVDWDRPLLHILEPIDDPEAVKISQLVAGLRRCCDTFVAAPVARRRELLEEAADLIRSSDEHLLQRATFQVNIPFYEDASVAATVSIPRRQIEGLTDALVSFVRLTAPLSWPRHERATMRHFFDTHYPEGTTAVPLLQYYEDFYREHFKEHLRKQKAPMMGAPDPAIDSSSELECESATEVDSALAAELESESAEDYDALNPFDLDLIRQMKIANGALTRLIQDRWLANPGALAIDIGRDELAAIVEPVPAPQDLCRSVSVFVQVLPGAGRDGGPAMVTSNFLSGFGKYFSRFLDLLPEQVQADLFDNNLDLSDQYLAEICGDGAFNGNLHPPLLNWELSYPTGESGLAEGQLLSSDLIVEPAAGDDHTLCLRHVPSGQRVVPLDLGFQNPRMRPALYQLLSGFGPACNYAISVPDQPLPPIVDESPEDRAAAMAARPAIQHRPRVTYEGALVLARRRWKIRAEVFPRRQSGETDLEYFLRANRWRREHGLPKEVFLAVRSLPLPATVNQTAKQTVNQEVAETAGTESDAAPVPPAAGPVHPRRRGHLHKPQYIDFDNPFLVDLLGRAAENLQHFEATLYERLPDREHLARSGDERYVTEMVLQLDFRSPTAGRVQRSAGSRHAA